MDYGEPAVNLSHPSQKTTMDGARSFICELRNFRVRILQVINEFWRRLGTEIRDQESGCRAFPLIAKSADPEGAPTGHRFFSHSACFNDFWPGHLPWSDPQCN